MFTSFTPLHAFTCSTTLPLLTYMGHTGVHLKFHPYDDDQTGSDDEHEEDDSDNDMDGDGLYLNDDDEDYEGDED